MAATELDAVQSIRLQCLDRAISVHQDKLPDCAENTILTTAEEFATFVRDGTVPFRVGTTVTTTTTRHTEETTDGLSA